jgi:hypothetical protein
MKFIFKFTLCWQCITNGMAAVKRAGKYKYSSAGHYLLNKSEWDFIADYDE